MSDEFEKKFPDGYFTYTSGDSICVVDEVAKANALKGWQARGVVEAVKLEEATKRVDELERMLDMLVCDNVKLETEREGQPAMTQSNIKLKTANSVCMTTREYNELVGLLREAKQQLGAYEEVLADHRRLVCVMDVMMNGEEGAAKQSSLYDIVSQLPSKLANSEGVLKNKLANSEGVLKKQVLLLRKCLQAELDQNECLVDDDVRKESEWALFDTSTIS